jgi:hypothetical protein
VKLYAYAWHTSVMAPGFLTEDVKVITVAYGGGHLTPAAYGVQAFQVPSLEALSTTTTTGFTEAIYDPERWQYTPVEEQNAAVSSCWAFSKLAKGRGYRVGFAPSPDLLHGKDKVARLVSEVIQPAAPHCDFIDLQIQQHELEPKVYANVASAAAEVCRVANPGVEVYAQLSCSPRWGARLTDLMSCIRRTRHHVDGFWLILDTKEGAALSRDFTARLVGTP